MKKIHIGIHFGNMENVLLLENLLKSIFIYNTRPNVKLSVFDSSNNTEVAIWLKKIMRDKTFITFDGKVIFDSNTHLDSINYKKLDYEKGEFFFVPYMKSFIDFFFERKSIDDYFIFLPEDCQLIYDLAYLDEIINFSEQNLGNYIISMLSLSQYRYKKKNNLCNQKLFVNKNFTLHKCKFYKGDIFSLTSKNLLNKMEKFNYPKSIKDHAHYVIEQYTSYCLKNKINRYYLNLSPFILFENKNHDFYLKILKKNNLSLKKKALIEKFNVSNLTREKLSEEEILLKTKWKINFLLYRLKLYINDII